MAGESRCAAGDGIWDMAEAVAAASALVAGVRAGRGGGLFIVGRAGLGKTSLLSETAEAARRAGLEVVIVRAAALEQEWPLALARQLLGSSGSGPDGDGAGGVAAAQRLARRLEQRWSGPTLVGVDDLQWADLELLAVLSYLFRRTESMGVGLMATLRPWPAGAANLSAELSRDRMATAVDLEPLTLTEAAGVLRERARELSDATVETVWRSCGGNPLVLSDAVRALSGLSNGAGAEAAIRLSPTTVRSFLAGLDPDSVQCAQAATVLEAPFASDLVTEIARMDGAPGDSALDTLCQAGVLRESSDLSLDFAQPLLREALYADLSLPMRRRFHARAFAALARRGLESRAADHALSADLFEVDGAVDIVRRAAAKALEDGSTVAAARHFRAAVELAGASASFDLRLSLGQTLLLSGRPVAAGSVLQRLQRYGEIPDDAARARVLLTLADACCASGRRTSAASHYLRAAEVAGSSAPELAVQGLVGHALMLWQQSGVPATQRALTEAEARCPDQTSRARVAAVAAYLASVAGNAPGPAAHNDPAWRGLEDPRRRPDALAMPLGSAELFGAVAIYAGQSADADSFLQVMATIARHEGAPLAAAQLMVTRADARLRLGRLDDAASLVTAAERSAEAAPGIRARAAALRAAILFQQGRLEESEEACQAALVATRIGEEPLAALWVSHVRAQRYLAVGDPQRAATGYREVERIAERLGMEEPCVVPWGLRAIEAHAGSSDVTAATRLTERLEAAAARLPCSWPRMAAAQGRAILAELEGDLPAAEAGLRAAIRAADAGGLEVDRIAGLLQLGRLLRRTGRRVESRSPLAQGLRRAEHAGADLLVGQLRDELAAAGGARSRRVTSGMELTPRERRVAELASRGRTNRQIAASLSVTVNTVETHLQRVFTKLSVRSRMELAAALTAEDAVESHGKP